MIYKYLGISSDKTRKKADLVREISRYLCNHPVEWMSKLSESDLVILRSIVDAGISGRAYVERKEFPSMLEMLKITEIEELDDDEMVYRMDEDLFFSVSAVIDQLMEEKETDGTFYVERLALGFLNLYGVMTSKQFITRMLDALGNDLNLNEKLIDFFAKPTLQALIVTIKGNQYIASPYCVNPAKILEARTFVKAPRELAFVPLEVILDMGKRVPFCRFGKSYEIADEISGYFRHLGYDGERLESLMTDLWVCSQYTFLDGCVQSLFDLLGEWSDAIASFEEYHEMLDAIATYMNMAPKWALRGYSADEVGLLELTIRVSDSDYPDPDEYDDDIEQTQDDADMPEIFKMFYNNGIGVRHVSPDAPCPCGSGLSYCHCHGKKLS